MSKSLSKAKKIKTPEEVTAEFRRAGRSVRSWAIEHGFCDQLVRTILHGTRPCHRGKSHKIAVLLGIKDGVIEESA